MPDLLCCFLLLFPKVVVMMFCNSCSSLECESVWLKVERTKDLYGYFYRFPFEHPQNLVSATAMLAIIAMGLGIIGVGVGIHDWINWMLQTIFAVRDEQFEWVSWMVATIFSIVGFGVLLSGPIVFWIIRR